MLAESMLWSVVLYFLLFKFMVLLMNPVGKTILQQVTLAIGAGIYEEFLFRVLLIAGLSGILGFVFMWDKTFKNIMAVVLSGGIFSAFSFYGRIWRFLFNGIILDTIFCWFNFRCVVYVSRIWNNRIYSQYL